jgi:hypothetical protein
VQEYADTDSPDTLAADDYRADAYCLFRLDTGTNPGTYWKGQVKVVHTPPTDVRDRIRLQIALVKLDLSYSAYTSEATQDEQRSPMPDYSRERKRILASVTSDAVLLA